MNKYYSMLSTIMSEGRQQTNKKGSIKYLTNQVLHLTPADLLDIFETHGIARKKLRTELQMFEAGITSTEQYRAEGITWWDYCGDTLHNSYPTCRHWWRKSKQRRRTARTMCCFSERRVRRQTSNHVCHWCNSR